MCFVLHIESWLQRVWTLRELFYWAPWADIETRSIICSSSQRHTIWQLSSEWHQIPPDYGTVGTNGFPARQHNNISGKRQSGKRAVSRVQRIPLHGNTTDWAGAPLPPVHLSTLQQEVPLRDAVQHRGPHTRLLCLHFQALRWGEMRGCPLDVWTSGKDKKKVWHEVLWKSFNMNSMQ